MPEHYASAPKSLHIQIETCRRPLAPTCTHSCTRVLRSWFAMSAVLLSCCPLLGLLVWPSANHRAMLRRSYLKKRGAESHETILKQ